MEDGEEEVVSLACFQPVVTTSRGQSGIAVTPGGHASSWISLCAIGSQSGGQMKVCLRTWLKALVNTIALPNILSKGLNKKGVCAACVNCQLVSARHASSSSAFIEVLCFILGWSWSRATIFDRPWWIIISNNTFLTIWASWCTLSVHQGCLHMVAAFLFMASALALMMSASWVSWCRGYAFNFWYCL